MYMSYERIKKKSVERKRINFYQCDRFDNRFLFNKSICGWWLFMHGLFNTNMAIVFSPLCPNIRTNHSSEICCISTWWGRRCRHPLSLSFFFSIYQFFLMPYYKRTSKREKRKIEIPVHSIDSWQDIWALYSFSFVHHSASIVLTDWFYSFHTVELRKKEARIFR
jgi:hypothetical protein